MTKKLSGTTGPQIRWGVLRGAQSGQSFVEFALSATVLILVFSGVVDLGRAFFSGVDLHSAVTEGTHWAGAYPACITTATLYLPTDITAAGGSTNCAHSNAISERILNEDGMLNRASFGCVIVTYTSPVTT